MRKQNFHTRTHKNLLLQHNYDERKTLHQRRDVFVRMKGMVCFITIT